MRSFSVKYIIGFCLMVCGVCAIFVSSLAVSLKDKQEINKALDKKKNVLMAAGFLQQGEKMPTPEIEERFARFQPVVIDLATGQELPDVNVDDFDQRKERKGEDTSREIPANKAGVKRLPNRALVYKAIGDSGAVDMVVLPVEGYGLWSTLYGFLALESDLNTIRGLAYYEHGETPGLGGEVENPRWRSLWEGRKAYGENMEPKIEVIKGPAGPVASDPYRIDGLSGATITARGVTGMMHLWLGDDGFGPYLKKLRNGGKA